MRKLFLTISMMLTIFFFRCKEKHETNLIGETTSNGVDLGIGDDETYKRPNSWSKNENGAKQSGEFLANEGIGIASRPGVSIAWRNASQVEEVEVRVRNLGNQAGEGKIFVDILDESGKILLHLTPPDDQLIVRVPAVDKGGKEGKIIRMKASRSLNNLIDRYDRMRLRYHVKATVETIGPDANWFDNSKTKTWNVPFAVKPGYMNVFNYTFKNTTDSAITVKWNFEHTPYPDNWNLQNAPENKTLNLKPGDEIKGHLILQAPTEIKNGAFLESRLSLVETKSNKIFQQQEWFQVYDTVPPDVSNYKIMQMNDNRIAIQLLASDKGSGILEATGVTTEYSTDNGRTWSTVAHNYQRGNFVSPTSFQAVLGPFNKNTSLQLRLTVKDTWGNAQCIIPSDISAMIAPPKADTLLDKNYQFPRLQAGQIFDLVTGAPLELNRMTSDDDKMLKMSTISLIVK